MRRWPCARKPSKVIDSGKQLKTIFISQADPDYYFGAEVLQQFFPEAEVITTPAVHQKIAAKLKGKLAFWTPKMGKNAPKNPVVPKVFNGNSLKIEGHSIEIRGTEAIYVPTHAANLWSNYYVYGGALAGTRWSAGARYMGDMEMDATNTQGKVPSYTVVDISMGYDLGENKPTTPIHSLPHKIRSSPTRTHRFFSTSTAISRTQLTKSLQPFKQN